MTTLDTLLRSEASSFALEMTRLAGLVIAAPLVWSGAPLRVRVALIFLSVLAVHGQSPLPPEIMGSPEGVALSVGSELMLGVAMGLVVRLVIGSVEVAAEQISLMMGLGIAQVFDPQVQGTHNVLSGFLRNLALMVAVAVGLHRIVLGAALQSFQVVPLGAAVRIGNYGESFAALGGQVLATGVRIALPVLAVLFMTQIALAFIARAAPAMQIFSIGFAVTLTVGAFVLIMVAPDLAHESAAEMSRVAGRIEAVVTAVAGDAR